MKVGRLIGSSAVAACIILAAATLFADEQMNIWPDNSPELKGVDPNHIPTLLLYPGPKAAGKKPAVLICPAGGYKHHSDHRQQVQWLNSIGIAAYVVKYRLPVYGYKHPAPLHDAQRAMRIVRQNAESWGLDVAKVGVIGGSSGGHVASTLATHYDAGDKSSKDPVGRQDCRPDFVMLCDAVITMQGKDCHFYSRGRLLPENPPKELVDNLSNELQVTPKTPPTFLAAGGQDRLVPAENSLMFFLALRKNHVAFSELHFFSHGGHGYQTPEWRDPAEAWMRRLGVLPAKEGEKPWPGQFDKGAWELGNYMKGE
jgi:acetyl esterase/lipase